MQSSKFKVGDRVRIVKYGHAIFQHKFQPDEHSNMVPVEPMDKFPVIEEDEKIWWRDMLPELVGKTGTIYNVTTTQDNPDYAIELDKDDSVSGNKSAWYHESQLELIK